MSNGYVGRLPAHDPLYHYLRHDILPQLGVLGGPVEFRVFRLRGSKEVYRYEERHTGASLVGKFFGAADARENGRGRHRMEQEFENLQLLRGYGFEGYPHHVARPWGTNAWLNRVLVEEYCPGASLSSVIAAAIHQGHRGRLFRKLTALAALLAALHNRTANNFTVDFNQDCAYLDRLVQKLRCQQVIGDWDADELYWLGDRWREQPYMWEDRQVLVHGDATPSNFLFGHGLDVIAIDLERMKRADRVFDLGRIAGELQHYYLQTIGDKYAAEPFIGHFLWEYSGHFPDQERAFRAITRRLPFQMSLTLLRIARNFWIPFAHRRRLVEEAKLVLRAF